MKWYDIIHYLQIKSDPHKIFQAISTSPGLNAWWTETSSAEEKLGGKYDLIFEIDKYQWQAVCSAYEPDSVFELTLTVASEDWLDTKVRFELEEAETHCDVRFFHTGWRESSPHFRISSYCWAMYLRLLKRYVEFGEIVDYADRLEA